MEYCQRGIKFLVGVNCMPLDVLFGSVACHQILLVRVDITP